MRQDSALPWTPPGLGGVLRPVEPRMAVFRPGYPGHPGHLRNAWREWGRVLLADAARRGDRGEGDHANRTARSRGYRSSRGLYRPPRHDCLAPCQGSCVAEQGQPAADRDPSGRTRRHAGSAGYPASAVATCVVHMRGHSCASPSRRLLLHLPWRRGDQCRFKIPPML